MSKIVTAAEVQLKLTGQESLTELNSKLEKAKDNADKLKDEFGESSDEFKNASNSVDQLSDSIDHLSAEAKELSGKNIANVNKSTKDLKKGLDSAKNATGGLNTGAKGLGGGLDNLGGGFGQAVQGAKALGKQFLALLANPIVLLIAAIVAALVGLFKAFTSTKKGGEQMDAVMAGISATIDVVRDRVLKVGSAIVKFFKGDWKGAMADAKGAVAGFGDEVAREFEIARQASLKLAEIKDRMRDLSVERARQNRDLAEAKARINDSTLSYQERIKALKDVGEQEQKTLNKELKLAKDKLAVIQEQNAQSDSNAEALDREAEAKRNLYQLEEQSLNKEKEINDQRRSLQAQASAAAKAQADAAKRARDEANKAAEADRKEKERIAKEEAQKAAEARKAALDIQAAAAREQKERDTNQFELRKQDLEAKYLEEREILKSQGLDTAILKKNYKAELYQIESDALDAAQDLRNRKAAEKAAKDKADADKELAEKKKIADAKAAIEQAAYNTARSFSNLIGELGSENLKVQKAQALIQIGIDTASAISSLVKMSQANPANAVTGGIAGALQFATGLLQIGTNIAKAANILGGSVPQVPNSNAGANDAANEINNREENRQQEFKVFVTETDIANATSKRINLTQVGIVQ